MRIARVEATVVPDLAAFLLDNPSTKLVLVNLDESKTNSLVEELTDHFGSRLGITKSHPYYTEAIHPGRIPRGVPSRSLPTCSIFHSTRQLA